MNRVGIIGVGCIGLEHIRNIHLEKNTKIVAIADSSKNQLLKAKKLISSLGDEMPKIFVQDYKLMLKYKNIDSIIIATPNNHHIEILKLIIPMKSFHILCEKPLTTTLEDANHVLELVNKYPQKLFWVGMEYRYIPSVARLIQEVDKGTCGNVHMVSIREHRFPFLKKINNWNRFSINTGGTLVEKNCHHFDLMNRILKPAKPIRIYASGAQDVNHLDETYDNKIPDILDNAFVIIDYDNGARAALDICMFAEASVHQEEISVVGDKGKIEAVSGAHGATEISGPNVFIGRRTKWQNTDEPQKITPVEKIHCGVSSNLMKAGAHEGSTYFEIQKFTEAILAQKKSEVTVEDGHLAVAMGIAAHTSINKGKPVIINTGKPVIINTGKPVIH